MKEILLHYDKEKKVVLENVLLEGQKMEGVAGRLMNPGHAIECGWFLLQHAEKTGEKDLARTAVEDFIKTPLSYGWDKEQGGIFYFMDAEGKEVLSVVELEQCDCKVLVPLLWSGT